jgi:hypothetical protein
MAAQPQPAAVAPVVAAHADGLVVQPALQVVDEGAHAAIALRRLLAQGLGGDGFQVAPAAGQVQRHTGAAAGQGVAAG